MAKLGYGGFHQISGTAGDWTFVRTAGETIVRRRMLKRGRLVDNPNSVSPSQMRQLTRAANVVNMWRVMRDASKGGYPDLSLLVSSYNRFFGYNMAADAPSVFLTNSQSSQGAVVVTNYLFTVGTLPAIEVSLNNGRYSTNINLSMTPDSTTTVAQFGENLLNNNPTMMVGDQLSLIRFIQTTDTQGIPRVSVSLFKIVVGVNDTRLLNNVVLSDYFQNNNGKLGTSTNVAAGGFVYVVSRRSSNASELTVSTQRIIVVNNTSVTNAFNTDAALDAASQSYGGVRQDLFLDPLGGNQYNYNAVQGGQDTDAQTSVSSVSVINNNRTYDNSQTTQPSMVAGNITVNVVGSNLNTATASVMVNGQSIALTPGNRSENNAEFTGTTPAGSLQSVSVNGQVVKSYNPATGGGGGSDNEGM